MIKAIDLSGFQGYPGHHPIDWAAAVASKQFHAVYQRATFSTTITDASLAYNVPHMRAHGVPHGFYAFAEPSGTTAAARKSNAQAQAEYFLKALATVGGWQADHLPPALDLEAVNGLSAQALVEWAQDWLAVVNAHRPPGAAPAILYTYQNFWQTYLTALKGTVHVWIAAYGSHNPGVPDEIGWQYSDTQTIAGITGKVDGDWIDPTLIPVPSAPTIHWKETATAVSWSFAKPVSILYDGWAQAVSPAVSKGPTYQTTGGYWDKSWSSAGQQALVLTFFYAGMPVRVTKTFTATGTGTGTAQPTSAAVAPTLDSVAQSVATLSQDVASLKIALKAAGKALDA